ncbi:uncharacterized protein LOC122756974 [Drosophila mojavensis]|uniref:uncharacterized protein LOC122756974 n=1 Tax=Drosophila mojavensis TaxID=7230 RepID=UPI001CD156D7|nr:uncharacterized protein LOC122756974 [Drosophila mojavensis]
MSLRFALICLALLVLVYAPLPTSAAPLEAALVEANSLPQLELAASPSTPSSDPAIPKQRTFFLLLPLLDPNQFYF